MGNTGEGIQDIKRANESLFAVEGKEGLEDLQRPVCRAPTRAAELEGG